MIAWDRLGQRAEAFRTIGDLLPDKCRIVETGTVRVPGNWEGDGQSTVVWSTFAQPLGGDVVTIDIDPVGATLVGVLGLANVLAITGDSLAVLPLLRRPADLLYLDSFDVDWNDPDPAAEHHLRELTAASHLLNPGSIVAVDDNRDGAGKGTKVAARMVELGAEEIVSGYVRAWRLP